ncbi:MULTISPECIES: hypothetical protein [Pseudomonas putida group]|uniref:Uncharacterized protein n=1 Tax=Pseudomonas putida TaxID=303 RepID=A0AAW6PWR1_PSEPU|nr:MULTISPECIES: hypothetical protein [Pseudomonas putida group]MDF3874094.1 hypothetical protein [Pseudomonas putida]MDF3880365.1 hypothetical protein [Pseudomonas putida]
MTTLKESLSRSPATEYYFADLYDDLGVWSEGFSSQPPLACMAYGYARRIAAQALYAQGMFLHTDVESVGTVLLKLRQMTDQTVEFQEAAFAQAMEVLAYHPESDLAFVNTLSHWYNALIANGAPERQEPRSDMELFGLMAGHRCAMEQQEGNPKRSLH